MGLVFVRDNDVWIWGLLKGKKTKFPLLKKYFKINKYFFW